MVHVTVYSYEGRTDDGGICLPASFSLFLLLETGESSCWLNRWIPALEIAHATRHHSIFRKYPTNWMRVLSLNLLVFFLLFYLRRTSEVDESSCHTLSSLASFEFLLYSRRGRKFLATIITRAAYTPWPSMTESLNTLMRGSRKFRSIPHPRHATHVAPTSKF